MLHCGATAPSAPLYRQYGHRIVSTAGSTGLHRTSTTYASPKNTVIHKEEGRSVSTSAAFSSSVGGTKQTDAGLHDLRASTDVFGPRGMLLVGFTIADGAAIEAWMQQMEPGFAVSHCTAPLLDVTVEQAVSGAASRQFRREPHAAVQEPLPRLVLLSGMTGKESVAIAEHWERFTGTTLPVFATIVGRMWQRQLREAILDIVKSYASSSRSKQKGAAEAVGLREMIRQKLEERKAQAGRRLIDRAPEPIMVQVDEAGSGREGHGVAQASMSGMPSTADDGLIDQTAVFRQQLADKSAVARRSRKEVHTKVEHKKADKRGFG